VLDRNLFAMPAESLATARVQFTVVGGQVVYRTTGN
jgi:predicted amidohydrolase YtcJ